MSGGIGARRHQPSGDSLAGWKTASVPDALVNAHIAADHRDCL
jgi:hypothetical protein